MRTREQAAAGQAWQNEFEEHLRHVVSFFPPLSTAHWPSAAEARLAEHLNAALRSAFVSMVVRPHAFLPSPIAAAKRVTSQLSHAAFEAVLTEWLKTARQVSPRRRGRPPSPPPTPDELKRVRSALEQVEPAVRTYRAKIRDLDGTERKQPAARVLTELGLSPSASNVDLLAGRRRPSDVIEQVAAQFAGMTPGRLRALRRGSSGRQGPEHK